MKRIQHFFNTLQTNWSQDPAARGAAKMTAGAVLVFEGVFGVLRQRRGSRAKNGKKKAGGLLGGIIGLVVGIAFIVVGSAMSPDELPDERSTEGVIANIVTGENRDGETRFRAVYEFEADGQTYSFESSMQSSTRPRPGQSVMIAYSASDPRNARRTDGLESKVHWLFLGGGIAVLLMSLFSLAVSIALITFGILLFRSGHADRKSAGESAGFFSDLVSLAKSAGRGEIDIDRTAVGQPGRQQGDFTAEPAPD